MRTVILTIMLTDPAAKALLKEWEATNLDVIQPLIDLGIEDLKASDAKDILWNTGGVQEYSEKMVEAERNRIIQLLKELGVDRSLIAKINDNI